jgi:hypothetical protein
MPFLGVLAFIVVWTAMCVAIVSGLEHVFAAMGFVAKPVQEPGKDVPIPDE